MKMSVHFSKSSIKGVFVYLCCCYVKVVITYSKCAFHHEKQHHSTAMSSQHTPIRLLENLKKNIYNRSNYNVHYLTILPILCF